MSEAVNVMLQLYIDTYITPSSVSSGGAPPDVIAA